MKKIDGTSILILLLILLMAAYTIVAIASSLISNIIRNEETMLEAFGLPDGGGIVVSASDHALAVTRTTLEGQTEPTIISYAGIISTLRVSLCNQYVFVFMGMDDGRIIQNVVTLDNSTGVCEWKTNNLFLPEIFSQN